MSTKNMSQVKESNPLFASRRGIVKNYEIINALAGVDSHFMASILDGEDLHWCVILLNKLGRRITFILMNLRNGEGIKGIQAVVTLEKQDVCLFEDNEELLTYASSYGENK